MCGDAAVAAVWFDDATDARMARVLTPAGTSLGEPFELAIPSCYYSRLALYGESVIDTCTHWPDERREEISVAVQAFDGTVLGRIDPFVVGDGDNYGPHEVAVDGEGNALVTWYATDGEAWHRAGRFFSVAHGAPVALGDVFEIGEPDDWGWSTRAVPRQDATFVVVSHEAQRGGWVGKTVSLAGAPPHSPLAPELSGASPFTRSLQVAGERDEWTRPHWLRPDVRNAGSTWVAAWAGTYPEPGYDHPLARVFVARSESFDACTNECLWARCGDGYPSLGIEECDYRHPDQSEICTKTCRLATCADADGESGTTAKDSLVILREARARNVHCPLAACDVDGSGAVDEPDATLALESAVGLEASALCEGNAQKRVIVVRLDSNDLFGALQLEISYGGDVDYFSDAAGAVNCTSSVPSAMSGFSAQPGVLRAGWISIVGFAGPIELARCAVPATVHGASLAFDVRVADAAAPDLTAITDPAVRLELAAR